MSYEIRVGRLRPQNSWRASEHAFLIQEASTVFHLHGSFGISRWLEIGNTMVMEQVKHHKGGALFEQDPWPIRTYTYSGLRKQWCLYNNKHNGKILQTQAKDAIEPRPVLPKPQAVVSLADETDSEAMINIPWMSWTEEEMAEFFKPRAKPVSELPEMMDLDVSWTRKEMLASYSAYLPKDPEDLMREIEEEWVIMKPVWQAQAMAEFEQGGTSTRY